MDLKLDGKTALVTRSSKGIGEAIARGLAHENAVVIVHGRDRVKTERVAQEIIADGGRAYAVVGDLTLDADVQRLVAEAQALVGPIDILVNNAGGSGGTEDWTSTQAVTWASAFDRNVLAAVRVTALLLPLMRAAKWGRVINISSLAGMMPPATRPDYSAAKAALIAMTASMAKAVARDGVTVNTVSPGTIRSISLETGFRAVGLANGVPEDAPWDQVERTVLPMFAQVPVGRVGTLKEIADAIPSWSAPGRAILLGRTCGSTAACSRPHRTTRRNQVSIFDHVSIHVSDFDKSSAFYGAALAALGMAQKFSAPRPGGHVAGYGKDTTGFFIVSGQPPQGVIHLAFAAASRGQVDAFHDAALAAGGRDNGGPGVRPRYHADYYAAFVFDPDGNNVEAVFQGGPN